jgi:hypothetical protein
MRIDQHSIEWKIIKGIAKGRANNYEITRSMDQLNKIDHINHLNQNTSEKAYELLVKYRNHGLTSYKLIRLMGYYHNIKIRQDFIDNMDSCGHLIYEANIEGKDYLFPYFKEKL